MPATILRRVRTPLIAAALLAGVPTVLALDAEPTPPETRSHSRTVEVRVENDDMTVIVDGKRVPADRLRREPDRIVVLDEQGRPMEDVRIAVPGMAARPMQIPGLHAPGLHRQPPAERNVMVFVGPEGTPQVVGGDADVDLQWTPAGPPRAMLGIRMENDPKGVRVTEVLPGTPAARAGLQPGDIILTGDGGVLTTERLAEKLRGFKPGQTVGMGVLRGDRKLDLRVELAAWNPDLLGPSGRMEAREIELDLHVGGEGDGGDDMVFGGDLPAELRELIAQAMRGIGDGFDGEMEIRIEVDDDDHGHDDDDHHGADDHHRPHDPHFGAGFPGDLMDAVMPHLEEMHREFESRWPEIERELDHRLDDFARNWERRAESFARDIESQFRSMHEDGERFGRGVEDALRRRAEEGEQFARRIGEALRRSEEQRRVLEERVSRLEAMIERLVRSGARPPRDAAPPPQDRPASPDRPRRRGGRGDAPATPTSDA